MEAKREKIIQLGNKQYAELLNDVEKKIDLKREKDFELMQMEDRNERIIQREEVRLAQLKALIQQQIQEQSSLKTDSKLTDLIDCSKASETRTGRTASQVRADSQVNN